MEIDPSGRVLEVDDRLGLERNATKIGELPTGLQDTRSQATPLVTAAGILHVRMGAGRFLGVPQQVER